jgi:hypothetical protein
VKERGGSIRGSAVVSGDEEPTSAVRGQVASWRVFVRQLTVTGSIVVVVRRGVVGPRGQARLPPPRRSQARPREFGSSAKEAHSLCGTKS